MILVKHTSNFVFAIRIRIYHIPGMKITVVNNEYIIHPVNFLLRLQTLYDSISPVYIAVTSLDNCQKFINKRIRSLAYLFNN